MSRSAELQLHKHYTNEKGEFQFRCNPVVFSREQYEAITLYGHWYEALTNGVLKAITPEQEHFVEVANMRAQPITEHEHAWFKYLKRMQIEEQHGEAMKRVYQMEEDTFYTRAQAQQLRGAMFGLIQNEHKQGIQ